MFCDGLELVIWILLDENIIQLLLSHAQRKQMYRFTSAEVHNVSMGFPNRTATKKVRIESLNLNYPWLSNRFSLSYLIASYDDQTLI